MALPENPNEGQQPVDDQQRRILKPEEIARQGGMKQEYFKAGDLVETISSLEKDRLWGNDELNKVSLQVLRTSGIENAVFGLDRADFYSMTAINGLLEKMGYSIDDWEDGLSEQKQDVLVNNLEMVRLLRGRYMEVGIKKEELGLKRAAMGKGYYEDYDTETRKTIKTPVNSEDRDQWLMDIVETNYHLDETKRLLNATENDPAAIDAKDFFNLIGCSPEKADQLANEARKLDLEKVRIREKSENLRSEEEKKILETESMFGNRERIQYIASAEARGVQSLAEYYGQVVKAISDLDSAGDLLTKQWNDKPANSEIFSILAAPQMDLAVTYVFRSLLDMGMVSGEYITRSGLAVDGSTINYQEFKEQEKPYLRKYGLRKSAFGENHTPETRRLWLDNMRKLIRDLLKDAGVERPNAWARQAIPVGLAFYEVLLLGSKDGTRYAEKTGEPIKVAKKEKLPDGTERLLVDFRGNPIYASEKGGPSTVTGWLNDLDEKAFRTKERFVSQGSAGYSAPTAMQAFGTPERLMRSMLEKEKVKIIKNGTSVEMSMVEAIKMGEKTLGECLGAMSETSRGVEALGLFRMVQTFNAIPATPLARLDIILNENAADDKFLAETVKYFSGYKKALDFIYGGEPWKVNLLMVNAINCIVRYARRSDVNEGGNQLSKTDAWDFRGWFDRTWGVVRTELCYAKAEIDPKVFDLGVALASADRDVQRVPVRDRDGGQRSVLINDRVGMLFFEDVVGPKGEIVNTKLMTLLSKDPRSNPSSSYSRVSMYGPDSDAFDPKTQIMQRKEIIEKLIK